MIAAFLEDIREGDLIAPRRLAQRLRVPMTRLSKLARVNRNTLAARPESPAVQFKLGQIARIIARVAEMTGDEGRAIFWFRYHTITGFGQTAEALVEHGHADLVMEDLDRMNASVYS